MEHGQYETTDSKLFIAIQEGLPLVAAPFAEIGRGLSIEEASILERIQRFKDANVIRSLSGVFFPRHLGYLERLVAFHVPSRYEDAAESILSNHPGIVECHGCHHDYNVWFSLVVPPGSDPEQHVERLASLTNASAHRSFPVLKMYKQKAVLPLEGWDSLAAKGLSIDPAQDPIPETAYQPPSPATIRLFQQLQLDLPLRSRPFETMAAGLGMTEEEFLTRIRDMAKGGRFAGIASAADPAGVGLTLGVWVLWVAPEPRIDEAAAALVRDAMVLHCSRRPSYPAWPYNLYTWLRVASVAELEKAVSRLANASGLKEHVSVKGVREYISVSKRYYGPEDWQWEKAHLGARSL